MFPAPPDDTNFSCLKANPSCSRNDPWWIEWMEKQDDNGLVQHDFLGPNFAAAYRLTEAVRLLWQWARERRSCGARQKMATPSSSATPQGSPSGATIG